MVRGGDVDSQQCLEMWAAGGRGRCDGQYLASQANKQTNNQTDWMIRSSQIKSDQVTSNDGMICLHIP